MKKILLAVALAMAVPILAQFTPQPLTTKNTGIVPLKGYFAFPDFATGLLPTPPRAGVIAWDSTDGAFKKWDGTAWSPLAGQPDLSGFLRVDGTTTMTAPLPLAPVNLEGFFIPPPGAPGGMAYASHDEWGGKPPTLIRTYYPVMGLGRSVDGVYEGEWERLATTNYIEELYSQLEPYIWPGAPGQYWDGTKTWVNLPTGAAWGSITGALTDQTDLSAALATKRSNSSRGPLFYENDFLGTATSSYAPWQFAAAGGSIANQTGTLNHPGVVRFSSGSVANTGYYSNIGQANTGQFVLGGGERYEVIFSVPTNSTNINVFMGVHSLSSWGTPINAICLYYIGLDLSGNNASAGNGSVTQTHYTMTAGVWYHGVIQVNDARTLVTYSLYSEAGTLLWTDSLGTFIPTAGITPCAFAYKDASTSTPLIDLDYQSFAVNRTLAR